MPEIENLEKVSAAEIGFLLDHFKGRHGFATLLQEVVNSQSEKQYSRKAIWEQLKYRPEGNDPLVINEARRLLRVTVGVEFELQEA